MRFKDLEEGKKYEVKTHTFLCNVYTKKDGLLYDLNTESFSPMTNRHIAKLKFKEIHNYVTFEEAIEHMKNGGKAKFNIYTYVIAEDEGMFIDNGGDEYIQADFFKSEMLEPKWILL